MNTQSRELTPSVELFRLWYEEGYPNMPSININGVGDWDWESLQFLNESSISVSDSSVVGTEVVNTPTLVSSINQEISPNGEGHDTIFLSFKAESPGRIKVTDLDVEYKMRTRAIGVYFDGDLAVPDGVKRTLTVKAAAGDDVEKVTRTFVELIKSNGDNPSFAWEFGDTASVECQNVATLKHGEHVKNQTYRKITRTKQNPGKNTKNIAKPSIT